MHWAPRVGAAFPHPLFRPHTRGSDYSLLLMPLGQSPWACHAEARLQYTLMACAMAKASVNFTTPGNLTCVRRISCLRPCHPEDSLSVLSHEETEAYFVEQF